MAKSNSVADMLARAAGIGAQLGAIHADAGFHKLSADAWRRLSMDLGGFRDVGELEAAQAKLADYPYLRREIELRGELFWRNGQDRPASWVGFNDGDTMPAAYAERRLAGLTVEQASAIAAYRVTELAPPEHFGRLDSFEELDAMVRPLHRELAELDQALASEVRLADLLWQAGRPHVGAVGHLVHLDETSATRLASAVAEMIADGGYRLAA